MADENIKELCMKIYQHHKQAIDLIIENLPNQRDAIAKELRELVSKAGLVLDDERVQTISFIPTSIDRNEFKGGSGWTKSGRMLLFELYNGESAVSVWLYLGPGNDSKRSLMFNSLKTFGKPFNTGTTLYAKWNQVYKRNLLDASDYELPTDQLLSKVRANWDRFLTDDMPVLVDKISQIDCALDEVTQGMPPTTSV